MEIPGGLGQVKIRPLTTTEYQQVKSRKLRGFTTTAKAGQADNNIVIDLEKATQNDYEADCMAVSMAMVEPRLSVDEVKRIKHAGITDKIAKRVYEISGITAEAIKELEKFRQQS